MGYSKTITSAVKFYEVTFNLVKVDENYDPSPYAEERKYRYDYFCCLQTYSTRYFNYETNTLPAIIWEPDEFFYEKIVRIREEYGTGRKYTMAESDLRDFIMSKPNGKEDCRNKFIESAVVYQNKQYDCVACYNFIKITDRYWE